MIKNSFVAEVAFKDHKLTFDKESKQIFVNVFAKDTNNFAYILPLVCFSKKY